MIDEDELDEVEEGLVDLAMRGWRTLDEHPLDPRSKRVQLEHNELSTLPKTIGTLEFMWKLDVSHNRLEALPRTIGKCTRLRILRTSTTIIWKIYPRCDLGVPSCCGGFTP